MLKNAFSDFKKQDWIIWILSIVAVVISNLAVKDGHIFAVLSSVIGVTMLIFVAKGEVFGQVLCVFFSLFYAVVSLQFHYYGEAITYLCMSTPIAAMSVVSWIRNPFEKGKTVVKIHKLTKKQTAIMWPLTALVTFVFYFILRALDTPNLFFSTLSIATSFMASYLTYYRNSYYALAYGANDIVLIVLWLKASMTDPGYIPMIICFFIFLFNDVYGFMSWKIREKKQRKAAQ